MKLVDILEAKGYHVHTAQPEDTILAAIRKLNAHNVGALAVVDAAGKLVGIITERDILRLTGQSPSNLAAETVEKHMTRDLITADCTAEVDDSLAVMTQHRIRHLPIVKEGQLNGMVSQGDLVKAKLDDAQFETRQLTSFVMGKYPA